MSPPSFLQSPVFPVATMFLGGTMVSAMWAPGWLTVELLFCFGILVAVLRWESHRSPGVE